MPKNNIIQVAKTAALQTKTQKEFNRLVKKIEKLEQDLGEYDREFTKIQTRVVAEFEPIRLKYREAKANNVRRFDRAYLSGDFKKAEKKKLAYLIEDITFDLIQSNFAVEEMTEIHDRYADDSYEDFIKESENYQLDRAKQMAAMFGLDISDEVDTAEKFEEYLAQQQAQQQADYEEEERIRAEKRAKKQKSEKQLALEEKKLTEERNITKAVRSIYMDLVKAFHPDREFDEAEKERKTQIMHRVTEAYEKNDILSLLKLQLEFNRIDQEHLEQLADDQLKYFNKLLKERAKELDEEMYEMMERASSFSSKPMRMMQSSMVMNMMLDRDIKEMKKSVKSLQKDAELFRDHDYLRLFLQDFKIPKDNQAASIFDIIGF